MDLKQWYSRRKASYVPRQPSPTLVRRKRPYSATNRANHVSCATKRTRTIDSREVMAALQSLTISKRSREEPPGESKVEICDRGLTSISECPCLDSHSNKRIRTTFNGQAIDLDLSESSPPTANEAMGIVAIYDNQAGNIPVFRIGGKDSSVLLRLALECLGPHRCVSLAAPLIGTMWTHRVQSMLMAPGEVPTISVGAASKESVESEIQIEEQSSSCVAKQSHSCIAIDDMDWWE